MLTVVLPLKQFLKTSPEELVILLVKCRPNLWLKSVDSGSTGVRAFFQKAAPCFLLLCYGCIFPVPPSPFPLLTLHLPFGQPADSVFIPGGFPILSFPPPCSSHTSSFSTLSSESFVCFINLTLLLHHLSRHQHHLTSCGVWCVLPSCVGLRHPQSTAWFSD